jgi:hypothetical protein
LRRLVAGGVAGVAAIFLVSVLILYRLTRDDPGRPPARFAPPPAPPPVDYSLPKDWKPGQPLEPPKPGSLTTQDFERLTERGPARVEPPKDSWEAVGITSSRGRPGDKAMAAVGRELNDLHETLSGCFDPATAARFGSAGITEVKGEEAEEDLGTTVFVLQLETRRDAVRVVDAPVQARGGASEETVACVQATLRGKTFEAPGTRGGERKRLQYRLIP